jgi:hypothetical protein
LPKTLGATLGSDCRKGGGSRARTWCKHFFTF